jgi:DNA sulfur modification protein DndB
MPKLGLDFEDEIRKFLSNIGFEDVPSWGRNRQKLILGNQEIDAFGRFGGLYLVVDAKTKTSLKHLERDVKKHLTLINGYREAVIKDLRSRFGKQHGYNTTLFIFWTKGLLIEEDNQDFARDNNIALRDFFDLNCYKQAYNVLESKEVVRNNFLKDLELQLNLPGIFQEGASINVDAIRTRIGNKELYTFLLDVNNFLNFAYVFRIETNNILASYQRLLKRSKIKKIHNYLNESGGYFPNNIIAATTEDIGLTKEEPSKLVLHGTLKLPNRPAYIEIIDGQHRVYGYTKIPNNSNHYVAVTLIKGLSEKEKASLFVTINKNQTPVPSYLLWDLYSDVEPESVRGQISEFVKNMNKESPFKNLIKLPRTRSTTAYLSFSSICFVLSDGIFKKFGCKDNFARAVRSYFAAMHKDSHLGDDWTRSIHKLGRNGFLGTNIGVSVQFKLLNKVLEKTGVPESDQMEEWNRSLEKWIVMPFKNYLESNKSEKKDDPYGKLRATNASEGARRRTAEEVFGQSPLSKETR